MYTEIIPVTVGCTNDVYNVCINKHYKFLVGLFKQKASYSSVESVLYGFSVYIFPKFST